MVDIEHIMFSLKYDKTKGGYHSASLLHSRLQVGYCNEWYSILMQCFNIIVNKKDSERRRSISLFYNNVLKLQ